MEGIFCNENKVENFAFKLYSCCDNELLTTAVIFVTRNFINDRHGAGIKTDADIAKNNTASGSNTTFSPNSTLSSDTTLSADTTFSPNTNSSPNTALIPDKANPWVPKKEVILDVKWGK